MWNFQISILRKLQIINFTQGIHFDLFFFTGNAVLLVIFAVIGYDTDKSHRGDLALYNILQIIFSIEFVLCVPGILWYLGMWYRCICGHNITCINIILTFYDILCFCTN